MSEVIEPRGGRILQLTPVAWGCEVSTVLLPEAFRRSLPYETMVFTKAGSGEELASKRYLTEEEARAGHWEMVERCRDETYALSLIEGQR